MARSASSINHNYINGENTLSTDHAQISRAIIIPMVVKALINRGFQKLLKRFMSRNFLRYCEIERSLFRAIIVTKKALSAPLNCKNSFIDRKFIQLCHPKAKIISLN